MNLKIDSLTTNFLRDVSFSLNDESAVIIGSNGAGKTTLAKAVVGLYENAKVYYDGVSLSQLGASARAKKLNFVPSKLEIFDDYIDMQEFLQLCLFNGSTVADMYDMLQRLDILHLKNSSCKNISSGESQLALFASGLLHNAELTIFDEPTANLDSDKKIKVYETLKECGGYKIVITHDLNLAYKLGFRILFLREGRLVFDGSGEEFFCAKNLELLFGGSIKKVDEYFTVNYS